MKKRKVDVNEGTAEDSLTQHPSLNDSHNTAKKYIKKKSKF
jgi:hypothetical protein